MKHFLLPLLLLLLAVTANAQKSAYGSAPLTYEDISKPNDKFNTSGKWAEVLVRTKKSTPLRFTSNVDGSITHDNKKFAENEIPKHVSGLIYNIDDEGDDMVYHIMFRTNSKYDERIVTVHCPAHSPFSIDMQHLTQKGRYSYHVYSPQDTETANRYKNREKKPVIINTTAKEEVLEKSLGHASSKSGSTVVNPDGSVTFNYKNKNAKQVQVDVQFAGRHSMEKGKKKGEWTLTLGPAAPDMYPYCYIVDGVSVMDPENLQFFPNEGFKNSLLYIPGKDAPLIHSAQTVPHGTVNYVRYYSTTARGYNNALVYTPPSYSSSDKTYPVFYLISGTTDTEEVYYKVGRMNHILDNLIAQGKAKEMIIVLPYGNPAKFDLLTDLMPYVESHYRTKNDRHNRAIGGFSRGGNQGLMTGLTNLDKFSYLCSYSSFTDTNIPGVYDNADDTNSKIHLFWAGVGTDDFLYGNARDYTEFLDQKGIRCVKEYTNDKFGHTWMNAKYFLDKTFRLLFNEEASEKAMSNAQPTKAKTGEERQFTPGVMARLFPKPLVSPEINNYAKGNGKKHSKSKAKKGGKKAKKSDKKSAKKTAKKKNSKPTDSSKKLYDITFRIKAENAKKVLLAGDMLSGTKKMKKDADGVWSVTIQKVKPEVYCYYFIVDGTNVADAQNMYLAPERGFKRSILDLTDANSRIDYSPVQYKTEFADNGSQSQKIDYAVVCPTTKATEALPVVVLKAEKNDTFEGWHKIAKANIILDQMIAEKKCKPCILVLTNGDTPNFGNAQKTLSSAKFKKWSKARAALIKTLKKVKPLH